jgi:hypothetical protein
VVNHVGRLVARIYRARHAVVELGGVARDASIGGIATLWSIAEEFIVASKRRPGLAVARPVADVPGGAGVVIVAGGPQRSRMDPALAGLRRTTRDKAGARRRVTHDSRALLELAVRLLGAGIAEDLAQALILRYRAIGVLVAGAAFGLTGFVLTLTLWRALVAGVAGKPVDGLVKDLPVDARIIGALVPIVHVDRGSLAGDEVELVLKAGVV